MPKLPVMDLLSIYKISKFTCSFQMATRGKYGTWSEDDLQVAITALRNGDHGLNACSRIYGIPKATLKRHADGKNSYHNGVK